MNQSLFVDLEWRESTVRIEYQWLGPERRDQPLLVFLHEGLGSVGAWKDFPERVCDAARVRGLVYSRPGYGRSSAGLHSEPWTPDFLHQQAHEVLPALLRALNIHTKPWLFGHSDGASIALLYAARFSQSVGGLVLLAPHIFVEPYALENIRSIRQAYLETDLRSRLARYHDDVDFAFWSWNQIWLNPDFQRWTIVRELAAITCPVLAIQGIDDEYGTLDQIYGIARVLPQTHLLELSECRHRAHRDQPDRVIEAVTQFILEHQTTELFNAMP